MVSPKHTDHVFAATPDRRHSHRLTARPLWTSQSAAAASVAYRLDRLFLTITAAWTRSRLVRDRMAQTCAITLPAVPSMGSVRPHTHVALVLEVIGLILP